MDQSGRKWPREKIKAHVRGRLLRQLDPRPYGCDAEQGRSMFDRLGGTQIIRDDGHFGDLDDPTPPSSS